MGFTGVCCCPAWLVAGCAAAGALAVAGAPAMGRGLEACLGDFAPSLRAGVLGDDVEVVVDELVVVVEVVESEAEETDVGDGGRSQPESEVEVTDVADTRASLTVGAGVGCSVLWAMRTKVRVWASGVCARLQWCSLCVPGLVLWVVSCVVLGGVVELSWLRRQVGYPGSTSAPGGVGVPARGIRGSRRSIAGCQACPLLWSGGSFGWGCLGPATAGS